MWTRLEDLANRSRRGARKLSAVELTEMIELYQRTSAHLAHVRTRYDDVGLTARLSYVVGSAQGSIYRRRSKPTSAVATFFTTTFPAAAWHARRQIAVAAFLLFAPALAMGVWLSVGDHARNALIPPETQRVLAEHDFATYYRSEAAAAFQTHVTTNNIQVSFMAFVSGHPAGRPDRLPPPRQRGQRRCRRGRDARPRPGRAVLGPHHAPRAVGAHVDLHRRRRRPLPGVGDHRPR